MQEDVENNEILQSIITALEQIEGKLLTLIEKC